MIVIIKNLKKIFKKGIDKAEKCVILKLQKRKYLTKNVS